MTHIFREHNKEGDLWAANGVKGREDEWVVRYGLRSPASVDFWMAVAILGQCGTGVMIQAFIVSLGWVPIHKKCGPVIQNSLDAKLGGCGVLMNDFVSMRSDKSMQQML